MIYGEVNNQMFNTDKVTNVHTCMRICTYFCDLGPFGTHPPPPPPLVYKSIHGTFVF